MKIGKEIKSVAQKPPIKVKLSEDEISKLTNFFTLLIEIDKRNRKGMGK